MKYTKKEKSYMQTFPKEIRLEELKGKAPCKVCVIPSERCYQSTECEVYQKWVVEYKKRRKDKYAI